MSSRPPKKPPTRRRGLSPWSRPISRILSLLMEVVIIYLGRRLPAASRGLPGGCPEREGTGRPPDAPSRLLGLAPDGGCLAASVTRRAGGLLHHLFTLTDLSRRSLSVALSAGRPARVLPGVVPCGVRTFLAPWLRGAITWPAPFPLYHKGQSLWRSAQRNDRPRLQRTSPSHEGLGRYGRCAF